MLILNYFKNSFLQGTAKGCFASGENEICCVPMTRSIYNRTLNFSAFLVLLLPIAVCAVVDKSNWDHMAHSMLLAIAALYTLIALISINVQRASDWRMFLQNKLVGVKLLVALAMGLGIFFGCKGRIPRAIRGR